jgi:endonuclease/exonuclease/phosphatase (EEP) superfamily protein YafD
MRSTGNASNDTEQAQVAELATKVSDLPRPDSVTAHPFSWPARVLVLAAWLATFAVGLIAILRFAYYDGAHLLIWLNAFARYVYLPSYVCLLVALWKRRRWLAFANLAIIACHLYLIAPDFMRDRRFDSASSAVVGDTQPPKKLRIFFANVRLESREKAAMLREIRDADPDIVVFVEFSFWWRNAVVHSPMMAAYSYGSGLSPDQAAGNSVNILSKLPLKSDTREWIAERCVETIEIPIGSQTLQLVGIHAPRPMKYRDNDYSGFWSRALPLLLEKHGPTIVIGDFNATQYSRVYQQLKAGGLRSAHEDRGRGHAVTWPNGQYLVPPIRIDQALLSADISCLGISEGRGLGSDHKPLILDVEIPQHP